VYAQARLSLSKERFWAAYDLSGSEQQAAEKARDICVEQTVEYPVDLIERDDIREQILGRVISFTRVTATSYRAVIDFPVEAACDELTQLLNILFGNVSLQPGVRLVDIGLPEQMLKTIRGPRFGRDGLRDHVGVADRPLLCTALKPMGLSAQELADLAYQFALGGIDIIKDDHGLTNQLFCPFEERVERCADAVYGANKKRGGRTLYLANITGPADSVMSRARLARVYGAGGLLLAPGLAGLDVMRCVAADDAVGLPIFSHPAMQGSFTVYPDQGISHGVLYGVINRLAGADACIFPNYGGRFSFTGQACRELVEGTQKPLGAIRPIFPVPAGGMSLDRVPELIDFYGDQAILLIGGDLYRQGPNIVENCAHFLRLVEQSAAQKRSASC
jgi:ribulose-bisphosphate carboxylase large chain